MSISNNMEFSTFDNDNSNGRCLAELKAANWYKDIGRICCDQSVNGIYNEFKDPTQYNGVIFWFYDTPLKSIKLMVRPVAWH